MSRASQGGGESRLRGVSYPVASIAWRMRGLADLLYPQTCVGCRRAARGGVCSDCLDTAPRVGPPGCKRCGDPSATGPTGCGVCRGRAVRFAWARQVFSFEGVVRGAVHRLKYSAESGIVEALALPLGEAVRDARLPRGACLTWVPGDPDRLRRRGFDHAALLTQQLAARTNLPATEFLERTRSLEPQVRLSSSERRRNQESSMRCRLPPPDTVVVVDDVFTTGATASEAARALLAGGAGRVMALALARALPPAQAAPL